MIGLQALDVHSTVRAVGAGAVEGNPAMKPFVGSKLAFASVKAGATYFALRSIRKLSKRNPRTAYWLLFASDVALSFIVASNYRTAEEIVGKR